MTAMTVTCQSCASQLTGMPEMVNLLWPDRGDGSRECTYCRNLYAQEQV